MKPHFEFDLLYLADTIDADYDLFRGQEGFRPQEIWQQHGIAQVRSL